MIYTKHYMIEFKGILGAILMITMPFLSFLYVALQILGALFGLWLVLTSIHNKQLEKKKLKLEIKQLQKTENEKETI